jgi:hypothetical protein
MYISAYEYGNSIEDLGKEDHEERVTTYVLTAKMKLNVCKSVFIIDDLIFQRSVFVFLTCYTIEKVPSYPQISKCLQ